MPLLIVLVITLGEMSVLRRLRLGVGIQSAEWDCMQTAYKDIFDKSLWEAKFDYWPLWRFMGPFLSSTLPSTH